jgi:hypothetical protein
MGSQAVQSGSKESYQGCLNKWAYWDVHQERDLLPIVIEQLSYQDHTGFQVVQIDCEERFRGYLEGQPCEDVRQE